MEIMLSQRTSIKKTDRKQNEETTTTSNKNRPNWQQERKSHVIHFALWRRRMISNVLPFIIHITHHVRFVFSARYYSHRSYCFLWVCAIQCVCVCVYMNTCSTTSNSTMSKLYCIAYAHSSCSSLFLYRDCCVVYPIKSLSGFSPDLNPISTFPFFHSLLTDVNSCMAN